MARTSSMTILEARIEKAQNSVLKAKNRYDECLSALEKLLNKRDALRRDELVNAILKSRKSYDEIIRFINSDN